MKTLYHWEENISATEWDAQIASMKGHPLQSATWGNARKQIDNIHDHRWVASKDGKPVFLVRFEERRIFKFIKIAWIPRGPTAVVSYEDTLLEKEFFRRLKKRGYLLCVSTPWKRVNAEQVKILPHHTMWVDLKVGKEALFANLDSQFRNGVRRAIKNGVRIDSVSDKASIQHFYELCKKIGDKKQFQFRSSDELMQKLLENVDKDVKAHLFVAKFEERIAAGAFILHCGKSIHYLWGAVDRAFAKLRVGEALQWGIMEWSIAQQCELYDLEGVNPYSKDAGVYGVYQFKKKLGSELVTLAGEQIYWLNAILRYFIQLIGSKHIVGFFRK